VECGRLGPHCEVQDRLGKNHTKTEIKRGHPSFRSGCFTSPEWNAARGGGNDPTKNSLRGGMCWRKKSAVRENPLLRIPFYLYPREAPVRDPKKIPIKGLGKGDKKEG